MIARPAGTIEHGWLQLFCVDSVDAESWYAYHCHPGDRAWRHEQYDRYLVHEVLPLSRQKNPNPFLITTGASFGGLPRPQLRLAAPGPGRPRAGHERPVRHPPVHDGYHDDTVYFHNPVDFIANEHDPRRLDRLQAHGHHPRVGQTTRCGRNHDLSHMLWGKGIWHALRVWDGFAHDWPFWHKMVPLYIGGHD